MAKDLGGLTTSLPFLQFIHQKLNKVNAKASRLTKIKRNVETTCVNEGSSSAVHGSIMDTYVHLILTSRIATSSLPSLFLRRGGTGSSVIFICSNILRSSFSHCPDHRIFRYSFLFSAFSEYNPI